jgi:hypothetical protein
MSWLPPSETGTPEEAGRWLGRAVRAFVCTLLDVPEPSAAASAKVAVITTPPPAPEPPAGQPEQS